MKTESTRESSSWVGLKATSFDVAGQMYLVNKNWQSYLAGDISRQEFMESSKDQILEDAKAWYFEFVAGLSVLPFEMERVAVGGGVDIICTKYGGRKWTDTISSNERDGATRQTAILIEDFLANAPVGYIAFFTSPSGWNGMVDAGENLYEDYLNTQTWIYKICEGGKIEATTIVTDMVLEENQQLLQAFGFVPGIFSSEKQAIKQVVSFPVFLNSDWSIEDIVAKIQQVMQTDIACKYTDSKTGKVKKQNTFDDIYYQLQHRGELSNIDHEEIIGLIDEFESVVGKILSRYESDYTSENLEYTISKLILDISAVSRGVSTADRGQPGFYSQEHEKVQDYTGACPRSGNVIYQKGFGARLVRIKNWEYKPGYCIKCQSHKSDVGPCKICKKCEQEFDKEEVWSQLEQIA